MVENWTILHRDLEKDYRLFAVESKNVRSPRTGRTMDVKAIRFPPWAMILAVTDEDTVVMVRQYRHGTEKMYLELPGGLVDPADRSPADAAQRELLEETGYRISQLSELGRCDPQPAILDVTGHFYLGTGARLVADPSPDAGEDIEVLKIPLADIPAMIAAGKITHGMVLLSFFFYWMNAGARA